MQRTLSRSTRRHAAVFCRFPGPVYAWLQAGLHLLLAALLVLLLSAWFTVS